MEYESFIRNKLNSIYFKGIDIELDELNNNLFDWQKVIVKLALKKGRFALFEECGLGKTIQSLEWSKHVIDHTNKPVLIIAPLAVSAQTKREGGKFGYKVNICKTDNDMIEGINITNYERVHHFDFELFGGIVCDESSIFKSFSGKIKNIVLEKIKKIPYRLCCTATPSPNDYAELGNHTEILGYLKRSEMLAKFFVHDGGSTQDWRLKKWASIDFWKWICTWSILIRKPSDIGFDDTGYILPKLNIHRVFIGCERTTENVLFPKLVSSLKERREIRRKSLDDKIIKIKEILGHIIPPAIIWCDLNIESEKTKSSIDYCVQVTGSDDDEKKKKTILEFANNEIYYLVTKPKIFGFGINLQNCCNMIFIGLSDSFESYYQAVRRCWRYGQKNEVNVYILLDQREESILNNIIRKENDYIHMTEKMIELMKDEMHKEIIGDTEDIIEYEPDKVSSKKWTMYKGDCVSVSKIIPDNSIDFVIYSPPFCSLYVYSDSILDMGNVDNDKTFLEHYRFLVQEQYRTLKPGRIASIHCANIPAMYERDGYLGIKNFRGQIIDIHKECGFIHHSEVVIWKDPLIEATRTKALGLMHKQLQKDSTICRAGIPDYVISFRKPGNNGLPVSRDNLTEYYGSNYKKISDIVDKSDDVKYGKWTREQKLSHLIWRSYASPVWMDIRQTNTLNVKQARDNKDEKHICPLQLDVIGRLIVLYTNPNDLVCSWFAGIGSEGYQALSMKRRFLGVELKDSYFNIGVKNLESVNKNRSKQITLF